MKPKENRGAKPPVAVPATWLEHMESEMEDMCRAEEAKDLELLLKNSPNDSAILESLKRVRAAVKQSDDVALPESGEYYDQLHAKIMAAISEEANIGEIEAKPLSRDTESSRKVLAWPQVFRMAGFAMMIAVVSWVGLRSSSFSAKSLRPSNQNEQAAAYAQAVGENFGRSVASVDPHAGADLAKDLGSYESEEDFVTEAAESRLQQVSQRDAEAMIRSLKM